MYGTSSHTEVVAGAVPGVGQVGGRGVSRGAGHTFLALTSHHHQAGTQLSPQVSLATNFLPLDCQHCVDEDPHSHHIVGSRYGSDSEAACER